MTHRPHLLSPTLVLPFLLFALPVSAQSTKTDTTEAAPSSLATRPGWTASLYGFVELDAIHDSTQSFPEASLNAPILPRGTYLGDNGRTQFTARNSRIGLNFAAPTYHGMNASGRINFDFFGSQPTEVTENDFYVVGTMRLRHAFLKLQTPVVDVLAGQHPTLFGWGGAGFYPGTVAFLGVVGQVYHNDVQFRLSKTLSLGGLAVEVAAAAVRPGQREAEVPDLEAGVRLAVDKWSGRTVQGNDRPETVPLSVGVSGIKRRFAVNEPREFPREAKKTDGWGVAVNGVLPIIPARSQDDFSNCLTLTGEFSVGSGVGDRYSFLTGGARFSGIANSRNLSIPPVYIPNVDNGLAVFDGDENLRSINWRAMVVGAQYYLPIPVVRVWVTGIYATVESDNLKMLTPPPNYGDIYTKAKYMDGSLFVGLTPDLHVGFSLQVTEQTRGTGEVPRNVRAHVATNLFF